MKTIDPTRNEVLKEYPEHTTKDIQLLLVLTQNAFHTWSQYSFEQRKTCMKNAAQLLRKDVEKYARLITAEIGKPITQARAEILKSSTVCDYFADNAAKFLHSEVVPTQSGRSMITFEPLGIILGIMPWNFPVWQVFRFGASTLMAGNAILLKHAPNVTGCALALEALIVEAGFPKHLFTTLIVQTDQIPSIISDPRIKAIALTGSERAGIAVGMESAKALKKTVLELGGSDPYIVLKDAEMSTCISTAVSARLGNCGQSCIAAKRFIVVKEKLEQFCQGILEKIKQIKVGDPAEEETEMGPIAREDLLKNLERQVNESIERGAKLLYGGKRLNREGFFYPPTILTDVKKGMPAYHEELFGPVFAIIAVKNVEEAIEVANDSVFGLGASLWTQNLKLAEELAKKIEAGGVYINERTVSDIQLPFGGIKRSGHGRELSHYGIKEFVNIKTVRIASI